MIIEVDILREVRQKTKEYILEIAASGPAEPIVDVGPMRPGGVFTTYPQTFVDARRLFDGLDYHTLDLYDADIVCDLTDADRLVEALAYKSVGTLLLLNVLEHMPKVSRAAGAIQYVLKPGGRAYILTPWALHLHGPRPDCWRISDSGYIGMFDRIAHIDRLEAFGGVPDNPAGYICEVVRGQR